jgi:7-carboxy-7-deazaguanine synthase
MTDKTLPIAETFGPTFQGEGRSSGRRAWFVRLGGCNLTCRDCDTPYTWDSTRYVLRDELTMMTAAQILGQLPSGPYDMHTEQIPMIVITGGEPLMYQGSPVLAELLQRFDEWRQPVEFETNGTIAPTEDVWRWPVVRFNVSPKLDGPMSVDPVEKRIVPKALADFAGLAGYGRAVFKFVCRHPADVDRVARLVEHHRIPPGSVWVMPEGVTPEATLHHAQQLADAVLVHGFNLTLRQHVLLWPDADRGR